MRERETILYVKNYIILLEIYKNDDTIFLRIGELMKKKIFLVIVLMTSLLLLTGCGKKALTIEEFTSSFDTIKYTVDEYENGQIDTIIDGLERGAYITNGSYSIDFYILENTTKAEELFKDEKETFKANKDGKTLENSIKSGNVETYELTTYLMYMYTCRVDNTLLYVSANVEDKEEIKSLIKNLGY